MPDAPQELAARLQAGDRRALARALSLVEDGTPEGAEIVKAVHGASGAARTVGITGPPGVGKSTLIAALVGAVREQGKRVGVLAVDPTSPVTGGALLGDRVRLSDHFLDDDVFIRSMGTRGHAGGLAEAALGARILFDAAGCHVIFLESVGVGQTEVRTASLADLLVLVLMPGSGDTIQALKAGIMELPDVIALTKRDHPGAKTARSELERTLALGEHRPPVVGVEGTSGDGVEELWSAIGEVFDALGDKGLARRREQHLRDELVALALARAQRSLCARALADEEIVGLLDAGAAGTQDPLAVVDRVAGLLTAQFEPESAA